MKSKRFDYVAYDQTSMDRQGVLKSACQELENLMVAIPDGRAKSLAITKLEELYMWLGKAIRDDQIARNGSAPLQEGRKDG